MNDPNHETHNLYERELLVGERVRVVPQILATDTRFRSVCSSPIFPPRCSLAKGRPRG
jgi:hypothetical protein